MKISKSQNHCGKDSSETEGKRSQTDHVCEIPVNASHVAAYGSTQAQDVLPSCPKHPSTVYLTF